MKKTGPRFTRITHTNENATVIFDRYPTRIVLGAITYSEYEDSCIKKIKYFLKPKVTIFIWGAA